jgi:hypothetical protein
MALRLAARDHEMRRTRQLSVRQRRQMARWEPDPLPDGSPRFVDAFFYLTEKPKAEFKMARFDKQDASVRAVDRVTGNIDVARKLVAQGVTTPERAEPIVRQMLEGRSQGRRRL